MKVEGTWRGWSRGLAVACLAACVWVSGSSPVSAYPEFQAFSQKNSGKQVNCAMCHANPDGPSGLKPGQTGSLTAAELTRLRQVRQAFEPGVDIDSPILNAFGNHIIKTLGRTVFIGLRRQPAGLAPALGAISDLDQDGISDADEYLQGTDPADSQSGEPWALFVHNLTHLWTHVVMLLVATLAGLYGLNNLLHWFAAIAEPEGEP
ncbi:MAG: hypothetical protein ABI880_08345 [Acidobacteriota bacterium]